MFQSSDNFDGSWWLGQHEGFMTWQWAIPYSNNSFETWLQHTVIFLHFENNVYLSDRLSPVYDRLRKVIMYFEYVSNVYSTLYILVKIIVKFIEKLDLGIIFPQKTSCWINLWQQNICMIWSSIQGQVINTATDITPHT
jgi:hypothetical protein